ncbi:putative cytochrome P450 139 [Micromonospora sonchi]|uniref:Cytochrome P450 139 n=1 Tax=Micromonospora sonchi TaxID=1763543 RepID=A0A917WVZ7_9ACTN|nr:cytochrome P450 [Micromonospora sonchi]GGM34038.1 putative cytochrome P450 139 [Micromonospora sonchi]
MTGLTEQRRRRLPGPTGPAHLRYARGLLGRPYDALLDLHRRYGPVCAFGFGSQRYVMLFGAEANQLLLTDNPARPRFLSRDVLSLLIPVVGARAMVVSDGEDHRRRRALVRPAFVRRRIEGYVPVMVDEIHRMIEGWPVGGTVNAFAAVRSCIRRIAIRSLFGDRLQAHTDQIGRELETALKYINRSPFLRFDHDLPGTAYRRAMAARGRVDELVRAEIAKRRAEPDDRGDVLDALLAACADDGDQLADLEVRDQVISLIASGYDSSSSAAGWAVYALLSNPEVYDRIRAEVARVAGDRPLTAGLLGELTYVGWSVSEILRLYTPGVLTGRSAIEDIEFAGELIPAGSKVLYSQYVTHRLPRHWADPLTFRPERWDSAAADYREPAPFSFVPFGGGYRKCIGWAFAELELRALIAELARRTELSLVGPPVQPTGVATMWPRGGVPVTVRSVRARPTG